MYCKNCGAELKENAKFCFQCGAKVDSNVCPKCNTPIKIAAKFCSYCGAKIQEESPTAEKREPQPVEHKEQMAIKQGGASIEHRENGVKSMDSGLPIRVEYINPFFEAAYNVLKELTGAEINQGELYLKPFSVLTKGIAAWVGLAGDIEGRVLFDMDEDSALMIVSCMNDEKFTVMDEMAKATIVELANIITAQAIPKLNDMGIRFDLTPSGLFTGDNMEVSSNMEVEIAVVPMHLVLGKKKRKIEINVLIQERN